jgi:acetyl-CoA carboxylase biotin carboxyl carrier protein
MDLQFIRKIFKALEEFDITEFELEEAETKLIVKRGGVQASMVYSPNVEGYMALPGAGIPKIGDVQKSSDVLPERSASAEHAEKHYHQVLSPIVGIFYRAPAPDAEPFVRVGQMITVGQQLCIIEAMKLMNNIESDVAGKVIDILVQNGQPIEYNQPLFLIDPA